MTLYISYDKFFSIFIEGNRQLGLHPLFSKEYYKDETIIHMPYIQIIYTPTHKPKYYAGE